MICPYFYFQYNDLICECVQEKVECYAILERCEHLLGRIAYLQDKEEENVKSN
jgi:hypothetical protein